MRGDRGVPDEGHLALRSEETHPQIVIVGRRRGDERGVTAPDLARELLHLLIAQVVRIEHHAGGIDR